MNFNNLNPIIKDIDSDRAYIFLKPPNSSNVVDNNNTLIIRKDNGFVNATKICSDNDANYKDWYSKKETKDLVKYIEKKIYKNKHNSRDNNEDEDEDMSDVSEISDSDYVNCVLGLRIRRPNNVFDIYDSDDSDSDDVDQYGSDQRFIHPLLAHSLLMHISPVKHQESLTLINYLYYSYKNTSKLEEHKQIKNDWKIIMTEWASFREKSVVFNNQCENYEIDSIVDYMIPVELDLNDNSDHNNLHDIHRIRTILNNYPVLVKLSDSVKYDINDINFIYKFAYKCKEKSVIYVNYDRDKINKIHCTNNSIKFKILDTTKRKN